MDAFLTALAEAFGSAFGNITSMILIALGYILFWAVAWGFWIERILSKARFIGFRFWLLFVLMNLIWVVLPLVPIVTTEVEEFLGGIAILAFWLGILLFAILPWPIRTKPKAPKLTN